MSELSQKNILILDCQTTGMHPSTGYLLQIGWSIFNPGTNQNTKIEKWTLKLPEELTIPKKIKTMLHITDEELQNSLEPQTVFNKLQKVIISLEPNPIVIAHYAQFELSFLKKFYLDHIQSDELNFQLICSQKISKRLLPQIPSHNLKAISGYFKCANSPKNEVVSHVSMTIQVWQQLIPKLIAENIVCYVSLTTWLNTKVKLNKATRYEYNIERLARLDLSTRPGIYRMLAEDQSILYIGKATSLKDRVNSYFRGVKNRDRRKLEMLAQVWDIETQECDSPLEAALLESDEIKKWNPPYNILLKSDRRTLIYFNRNFNEYSEVKNTTYYNGPYKPNDAVIFLLEFFTAIEARTVLNFGEDCITPEMMQNAWVYFCNFYQIEGAPFESLCMRTLFLIGYQLLKQFEVEHGKGTFQKWWANEKKNTIDNEMVLELKIAHKISRILIRGAEAKRKTRTIWRLYNSTILIHANQKQLRLINGELCNESSMKSYCDNETSEFNIFHYDRISILLSALNAKTIAFSTIT